MDQFCGEKEARGGADGHRLKEDGEEGAELELDYLAEILLGWEGREEGDYRRFADVHEEEPGGGAEEVARRVQYVEGDER